MQPPSPTPEQWAACDNFTRLTLLQHMDTDGDRRQVIARHLAVLGPYVGAGADAAAGPLIEQYYTAEAARLAGTPRAGEE